MNLSFPETALHAATSLAYVVHVGGGTTGLASGTVAAFARKGERLHRAAGTVFFVSMLVMAVFAAWLAVAVPGQMSNLLGAILSFYLVTTGWLTVRRAQGVGRAEKIALAAGLSICAALGGLSVAEAAGVVPGVKGQLLAATYMVTAIAAVGAIGDARLVLLGGIAGTARVARHLWRMLTALFLAFGSGFGNGLARLLPGPFHGPPPLFLVPMLLPLGLLIFWMIRVTLTGWMKQARLA